MGLSDEVFRQLSQAQVLGERLSSLIEFSVRDHVEAVPSCALRCLGEDLKAEMTVYLYNYSSAMPHKLSQYPLHDMSIKLQ